MCRRLFPSLLVLFVALPLFGSKAYPLPVPVRQPDGTVIHITIHGDESFSYKTNATGYLIAQGYDGCYYYVSYRDGVCCFSDKKVTDSDKGISKLIPSRHSERKAFYQEGHSFDKASFERTKGEASMKTVVIPVQFQNLKFFEKNIESKVYNLFNQLNYNYNDATGSVSDYFNDNLGYYGKFDFSITPVVTVSNNMEYYGANNNRGVDENIQELVAEACQMASRTGFDFASCDGNGDGVIDNVIIFFAGYNESEGGGDNAIWPQSWNLRDEITLNGKVVSGFSCCSELSGADGSNFTGIGTICHEYCHFLGLPDLYDVNGPVEGQSAGLAGSVSIMDNGNFNNDGKTPPYLTSLERYLALDSKFCSVFADEWWEIPPVYQSDSVYAILTENPNEFFIVENRDGSKWDRYIGGNGLLVYHIDMSENAAGRMSASNRWLRNCVNADGSHPCATLVSHTGDVAGSAASAFFPGEDGISSILSSVSFPLMAWNNRGAGLGISLMEPGYNGIRVKIDSDEAWMLPFVADYMIYPKQTEAVLSWKPSSSYNLGNWVMLWRQSTSLTQDTIRLMGTEYSFRNLVPGSTYIGEIFFEQGLLKSKRSAFSFDTIEKMSSMPLIGFMDRAYYSGDELMLTVLNIEEEYSSIVWYINNLRVSEPLYEFKESGKYLIEAYILYPDGSVEKIQKHLSVL